ncbi:MAG: DUF3380 domain-containing protein [Alphaproteobacteria bacterium]|nr:DUF3380 domain-containing protein [Alphaproteobacteria bacterium]
MAIAFVGKGTPLSAAGLNAAAERLGTGAAEIWTVIRVETSGCGFLADRRPKILFERHAFSRASGGRFDAEHPDLSNRQPGGYGTGGAAQYARLERAMALDERAALESCSWGLGQVMGYHAGRLGYRDAAEMARAMVTGEDAQLGAMAGFIAAFDIGRWLKAHDWTNFARAYNGPAFERNQYDRKLKAAFEALGRGRLPGLDLRAAQIGLTYRGLDPGPIDGQMGSQTGQALRAFQARAGLAESGRLDAATKAALERD